MAKSYQDPAMQIHRYGHLISRVRAPLLSFLLLIAPFVPLPAQSEPREFICKPARWAGTGKLYPYVIVAIMRSGAERPFFPVTSGTSLENRCRIIVERLNSSNTSGRLRFLTWGTDPKSGQYICSVSYLGAICQENIFQLLSKQQQGNEIVAFIGSSNEDAIRYRDGRAYLNVSTLLDPSGTECGDGYELKDDRCQPKPPPPCPDGASRGADGACLCPPGKIKTADGSCKAPIVIECSSGTVPSPDGKNCIIQNPSPLCPIGWGSTPSGCAPLICPAGMIPTVRGCSSSIPQPSPVPQAACPPGMNPILCHLILPRN